VRRRRWRGRNGLGNSSRERCERGRAIVLLVSDSSDPEETNVHRTTVFCLLAFLFLLSPACARPAPEAPEAEMSGVLFQVVSHEFNDVVIYLHTGGARQRLGTATGHGTSDFEVPWRRVASSSRVRLLAYSIGTGRWASSGALQLRPGSKVQWTLQPGLSGNSLAVY
jgi:hypothetical protein